MTAMPKIDSLCKYSDNNFNLIRLLCAWGVLFAHSYVLILNKPPLTDPFQSYFGVGMGTFFVTVFFSISGFLIFRSLDRSQNLKKYGLSRCKRIIPALLVVVLLTVFVLGPTTTEMSLSQYFSSVDTWRYLLNINILNPHTQFNLPGVFLNNHHPHSVNGSLWTLPIETWMYVLTALMYIVNLLLKRHAPQYKTILWTIGFVSIAVYACFKAESYLNTQQFEKYSILFFACTFTISSLFYHFRRHIGVSWTIAILLVLCTPIFKNSWWYPLYFSLTITYVVLVLAFLPAGFIRAFNQFGDYSYGLYIYAFPVQQVLVLLHPNINFSTMLICSTFFSLVLAALSWHLVEGPILNKRS